MRFTRPHKTQKNKIKLLAFCGLALREMRAPNAADVDGNPVLQVAAYHNSVDCLALLLEANVDSNKKDECGDTALIPAAKNNNAATSYVACSTRTLMFSTCKLQVSSIVSLQNFTNICRFTT